MSQKLDTMINKTNNANVLIAVLIKIYNLKIVFQIKFIIVITVVKKVYVMGKIILFKNVINYKVFVLKIKLM